MSKVNITVTLQTVFDTLENYDNLQSNLERDGKPQNISKSIYLDIKEA